MKNETGVGKDADILILTDIVQSFYFETECIRFLYRPLSLIELDFPQELLQKKGGAFEAMVDHDGS
jgi:uncharacterized protein (DUF2384 family)